LTRRYVEDDRTEGSCTHTSVAAAEAAAERRDLALAVTSLKRGVISILERCRGSRWPLVRLDLSAMTAVPSSPESVLHLAVCLVCERGPTTVGEVRVLVFDSRVSQFCTRIVSLRPLFAVTKRCIALSAIGAQSIQEPHRQSPRFHKNSFTICAVAQVQSGSSVRSAL
jgi:hypothetical protein